MLAEVSTAITKEKELASISLCKVKPDKAKTNKTTNKILKSSKKIFFESKSMPLTFAIASKFANFRLLPLIALSPKK